MAEPQDKTTAEKLAYWKKRLGASDYARYEAAQQYLDILFEIYQSYYEEGLINAETAESVIRQWEDYFEPTGWGAGRGVRNIPKDAPFSKELMGKGQIEGEKWVSEFREKGIESQRKKIEAQVQETTKRQTASLNYLPQLSSYLQRAVGEKEVTPEEARKILETETQQLGQGVDPKNLANYQGVQSFLQYTGDIAQQETEAKQQQGEAAYLALYNPKTQRPWLEGGQPGVSPEEAGVGHQLRSGADIDAAESRARWQEHWQKEIPPLQSATTVAYPWLEKMTIPSMKSYYQRNLGDVYAQAGGAEPREAWKAEQQRFPTHEEMLDADSYGTLLSRQLRKKDPWLSYLEGFPTMEKYKELTPQERGFYSSQYQPMTAWLTGK